MKARCSLFLFGFDGRNKGHPWVYIANWMCNEVVYNARLAIGIW